MKALAIALVVVGFLGLAYGGFSYTYKDKVLDAGPLQLTRDKTEHLPIPPIAGGLLLVAGLILLVRRDSTS